MLKWYAKNINKRPLRNIDLMITGLCNMLEGFVLFITLGYYRPYIEMKYVVWRTDLQFNLKKVIPPPRLKDTITNWQASSNPPPPTRAGIIGTTIIHNSKSSKFQPPGPWSEPPKKTNILYGEKPTTPKPDCSIDECPCEHMHVSHENPAGTRPPKK